MLLLMNDGARNARLKEMRNVCAAVRLDHERRPRREDRVVDRRELVHAAADDPAEVIARGRSRPGRRRRPRCGRRRWARARCRTCCGGSCRHSSGRAACRSRARRWPRRRTSSSRSRAAAAARSAPRVSRLTASPSSRLVKKPTRRPPFCIPRGEVGQARVRCRCRTGPMPVWMMPFGAGDAAAEAETVPPSSTS